MQTVDLTHLGDEFVFHFGGEFHRINAETLANSLLEISAALKEINRSVNPNFEIDIYIDALGEGSFRARIKAIARSATPLIGGAALSIVASLLASFIYDKIFADNPDVKIIINDDSYIVETADTKVILPKHAEWAKKKISNNSDVERRVSQAFKALQDDPEIQNFGITETLQDMHPLVLFPRSDFPSLSEIREVLILEDERRRSKDEQANLLIIRAIFERGPRKWQFVWRDGIKISAPILAEGFYDKLVSHEYVIGTGDTLQVTLRIHQNKDEMSGVWINERYEVLEVHGHTPAPQQHAMFKSGKAE